MAAIAEHETPKNVQAHSEHQRHARFQELLEEREAAEPLDILDQKCHVKLVYRGTRQHVISISLVRLCRMLWCRPAFMLTFPHRGGQHQLAVAACQTLMWDSCPNADR